jgi:hypothetical protein
MLAYTAEWSTNLDAAPLNEGVLVSGGMNVFIAERGPQGWRECATDALLEPWEVKFWMPLPEAPEPLPATAAEKEEMRQLVSVKGYEPY